MEGLNLIYVPIVWLKQVGSLEILVRLLCAANKGFAKALVNLGITMEFIEEQFIKYSALCLRCL